MKEEFCLSDKSWGRGENDYHYSEKDVKEFIKRLKEILEDVRCSYVIDKLAGEKLI